MVRATYTVAEAAELLGISLNAAYKGVRSGDIPSLRVGRRILVPRGSLNELLAINDSKEARHAQAGLGARGKTGYSSFYREGRKLTRASGGGGESNGR